jgi:hypothetical protein
MPLVEHHVIARTDQHARPIAAAACASKTLWYAANDLLAEVTSLVSRRCVQLASPRSTPYVTEPRVQAWEAPDAAC